MAAKDPVKALKAYTTGWLVAGVCVGTVGVVVLGLFALLLFGTAAVGRPDGREKEVVQGVRQIMLGFAAAGLALACLAVPMVGRQRWAGWSALVLLTVLCPLLLFGLVVGAKYGPGGGGAFIGLVASGAAALAWLLTLAALLNKLPKPPEVAARPAAATSPSTVP